MINYTVKVGDGEQILTPSQIMYQLNAAFQQAGTGTFIEALSPDGRTFTINQNGESFSVPIKKVLEKNNLNVVSALPIKDFTDYDAVQPSWRYAISNLENDHQRKAYLEQKLQEDPSTANLKIEGGGRDWFAYSPQDNKYIALTNNPEWDVSDIGEGLTDVIRYGSSALGATLAGGLASPTGPGAIAAGAAGAAGGQAFGEGLSRSIAALDPAYRKTFDLGRAVEEIPGNVAAAGAFGAAGPIIGKGLSSLAQKYAPTTQGFLANPISKTVGGAGRVVKDTGEIISTAGKLGTSGFGGAVGTAVTPGLGTAQLVGAVSRLPSMVVGGVKSGLEKYGKYLGQTGDEFAQKAAGAIGKFQQSPTGQGLEELGRLGKGVEEGAEAIFKTGSRVAQGAGNILSNTGRAMQGGSKVALGAEELIKRGTLPSLGVAPMAKNLPMEQRYPLMLEQYEQINRGIPQPMQPRRVNPYGTIPVGGNQPGTILPDYLRPGYINQSSQPTQSGMI